MPLEVMVDRDELNACISPVKGCESGTARLVKFSADDFVYWHSD